MKGIGFLRLRIPPSHDNPLNSVNRLRLGAGDMELERGASLGFGLKHPAETANIAFLLHGPCVLWIVGPITKKRNLRLSESVGTLQPRDQVHPIVVGLSRLSRAIHSPIKGQHACCDRKY